MGFGDVQKLCFNGGHFSRGPAPFPRPYSLGNATLYPVIGVGYVLVLFASRLERRPFLAPSGPAIWVWAVSGGLRWSHCLADYQQAFSWTFFSSVLPRFPDYVSSVPGTSFSALRLYPFGLEIAHCPPNSSFFPARCFQTKLSSPSLAVFFVITAPSSCRQVLGPWHFFYCGPPSSPTPVATKFPKHRFCFPRRENVAGIL